MSGTGLRTLSLAVLTEVAKVGAVILPEPAGAILPPKPSGLSEISQAMRRDGKDKNADPAATVHGEDLQQGVFYIETAGVAKATPTATINNSRVIAVAGKARRAAAQTGLAGSEAELRDRLAGSDARPTAAPTSA